MNTGGKTRQFEIENEHVVIQPDYLNMGMDLVFEAFHRDCTEICTYRFRCIKRVSHVQIPGFRERKLFP